MGRGRRLVQLLGGIVCVWYESLLLVGGQLVYRHYVHHRHSLLPAAVRHANKLCAARLACRLAVCWEDHDSGLLLAVWWGWRVLHHHAGGDHKRHRLPWHCHSHGVVCRVGVLRMLRAHRQLILPHVRLALCRRGCRETAKEAASSRSATGRHVPREENTTQTYRDDV